MTDTLVAELGAALSPDRVRVGDTELALYKRDASNLEGHAGVVCFPTSTDEVQACVSLAVRHGRPFIARGAGTGLAGGATPLDDAMMIVTTKMNQVLSVDPVNRLAWVQPGVLNLDLTRAVSSLGSALRTRPQQSAELLDRRQRRQQLRRAALPLRRGHHRAHPRSRSRAPRRSRSCSSAARKVSRRDTTCAARSSAARACAVSPRRCASA